MSHHPPPQSRLLVALCLLLLALPALAAEPPPLVLSTSAREPRSLPDGSGVQDRIVKEAFRRIGQPVSIVYQPPERALVNADEGLIDGDCWRVAGGAKQYPNLLMVPEPVDEASVEAFTKNPSLSVSTWADLAPLNVAYLNGWKVLDASVHNTRSLLKVKDMSALFALLDKGRIDVALVDPLMGWAFIRKMKLTGIHSLKPPLTRQDMYVYLNRRHADLVPKLAAALRDMKRDGTTERLTRAGLAGRQGLAAP
jgi:polar amino acid transport system substrate-binding protein